MDWHTIVDIHEWIDLQEEVRGRRDKKWVLDPNGQAWLAKLPRGWDKPAGRLVEPVIEAFTLHLASLLGLRVAQGQLARWQSGGKTIMGFISRRFTDDERLLMPGSMLLATSDAKYMAAWIKPRQGQSAREYEVKRRAMATIDRSLAALRDPLYNLATEFLSHLIFDAWIGNGDRHPENWGMLVRFTSRPQARVELAPMFDTASFWLWRWRQPSWYSDANTH